MKKLLFLLVPFMVLVFSFNSKCATSSDVANLQSAYQTKFGYSLNANNASQIVDKWQSLGDVYCFILYSENQYHPNELPYSYTRVAFTNVFSDSGTAYSFSSSNVSQDFNSSTNTSITWSNGGSLSWSKSRSINMGKWSDFHTVPIDWDNPYYSANIPAPVFEVYNAELNVVPVVDVPLSFDFQFVPSNTYVEVWVDYTVPTKLNVVPQPNNGAQYRVLDYNVVSVNVLDKELLFESEAINSSYMHVILTDGWDDVLENFPISNIEFTTQAGTQAWLDNRISEYEDLRKTNTLYGSAIKIKMRYFTLVNETQFVVGPWRIWDSKNPETFTNELPTNYQVYLPANGTTGTNTDTSTNVDIPVGSGTPTGTYYDPAVNITVTQNVPNYPDYPTIASYNLDNMLVDTMNNVRGLNSFFGEFGGFIQSVFVFLPSWIWAIIGVGFSLSIIVMFLKIL